MIVFYNKEENKVGSRWDNKIYTPDIGYFAY